MFQHPKQQCKQLKFNQFKLSMWVFFKNIYLTTPKYIFSDLGQLKDVQKENIKCRKIFEAIRTKPEFRLLPQKCHQILACKSTFSLLLCSRSVK